MRALFLFTLLMLLPITVSAAEESLIIKANDDGQVIVDADQSLDGNEYVLNEAVPDEQYNVQLMSATTFNTLHYTDGFFDSADASLYTTNNIDALNKLIDNDAGNFIEGPLYLEINFINPVSAYALYSAAYSSFVSHLFYDDDIVYTHKGLGGNHYYTRHFSATFVTKIIFDLPVGKKLKEFELYTNPIINYVAVNQISVNAKINTATLTFKNPNNPDFVKNEIMLDDQKIATTSEETYEITDLEALTEYTVTIRSYYTDGKYIDAIKKFRTTRDKTPPANVTDLTVTQQQDQAVLNWVNPTDTDFDSIRIYRNGMLLAKDFNDTSFIDAAAKANVNYSYRVVTVDKSGNAGRGVTVTFTMPGTDVYNVVAKSISSDVVDIKWANPLRDDLDTVKIYRKKKPTGIATFAALFNSTDYQPLFQTNGTTFTDLTVAPDTAYTYKLATVIASTETDGIEVDVKTPPVKIAGDTVTEIEENGQKFYLVKWNSPGSGKIQVLVGSVEYAIVNAADKQIKIPAADMLYTKIGTPDVSLVPVDDANNPTGLPSQPSGGLGDMSLADAGLDAKNLMIVAMLLIGLVMSIILLALAFKVTPKVIDLIVAAFK